MELQEQKARNMATLHCRSCGGDIDSNARRSQCRKCGALFPFQCEVCQCNLRTPFPIFEDERYLTLDESAPQPLCGEHFLRKCPDCDEWFQADENPGFFRCGACAEKAQAQDYAPESEFEEEFEDAPYEEREVERVYAAPVGARARFDSNTFILAAAGFAFVALMAWSLIAR